MSNEPNWEDFRIDPTFDPPGIALNKLFAFQEAYINWRQSIKQPTQAAKKAARKRGKGSKT